MKVYKNLFFIACITGLLAFACNSPETEDDIQNENRIEEENSYDAKKAELFGADEYGMKKYVMAFLKRGSNNQLDSLKKAELQTAHLKNIDKMAEEGKLVLAGPFFGDGELRGIYIFNVKTIEEAEKLTNTDPAIQAGTLIMELKEWYGSAALIEVNDIHKALIKKSTTEE